VSGIRASEVEVEVSSLPIESSHKDRLRDHKVISVYVVHGGEYKADG
jgi:hypothetical protein